MITGASVLGKSHEANQTVCQDAYAQKNLPNDWGIVCVSDGAGSYSKAERGSQFLSKRATEEIQELVYQKNWIQDNTLPSEEDWQKEIFQLFKKLRQELQQQANKNQEDIMEFSATLIALLYSPKGICVAHIGDGRAAYQTEEKTWKSLMIPYEGTIAGSTVFLSQDLWINEKESFFEAKVIRGKIRGFSVMSDGMESASFITKKWNEEKQQILTINSPDQEFFDAITKTFLRLKKEQKTPDQIKARWVSFMENGNEVLKGEMDDKTFILGLYA